MPRIYAKPDRKQRSRDWSHLFADMVELELLLGANSAEGQRLHMLRYRLLDLFEQDTNALYPPTQNWD